MLTVVSTVVSTVQRVFLCFGACSLHMLCCVAFQRSVPCLSCSGWVTCELCFLFAHEYVLRCPCHAHVKTHSSSHHLNTCCVCTSQLIIHTHANYLDFNGVTLHTTHWKLPSTERSDSRKHSKQGEQAIGYNPIPPLNDYR